jgi:hypothetical protein
VIQKNFSFVWGGFRSIARCPEPICRRPQNLKSRLKLSSGLHHTWKHLMFSIFSIACLLIVQQSIRAADLSTYRQFQFGMSSAEVTKLAGLEPSAVKMLHQRPAVIEELEWMPHLFGVTVGDADPVHDILFSFYNGHLYRILVHYDSQRTEGMTTADLIQAISGTYGAANNNHTTSALPLGNSEFADLLARWEDSQFSYSLVRLGYGRNLGMVAFSKGLERESRAAIREAIRLDEQEFPAKEIQRQKDVALAVEKSRPANNMNFRP